jgi:hypothetical protein
LAKLSPPLLEGDVVDTSELQVEDKKVKTGDVLKIIFGIPLLFINFVAGIMTLFSGGSRPKDYKHVFTFRVQRANGTIVLARIERDMIGATINIGDHVSVWGKESSGVVIVIKAFNHTINGEVRLL